MYTPCICFRSVSKIEKTDKCDFLCRKNCEVIKRYKELEKQGKINIIKDIANFRQIKHQDNERSVDNGSGNKSNFKRTLSKGRKKFKNKSK